MTTKEKRSRRRAVRITVVATKPKKTKVKQFRSDASKSVHSFISDLHKAGAVDKQTMRSFDESCIVEIPAFKPQEIRKIRLQCNCSQRVFARYLNASESTVEKWETGASIPKGATLKLLHIVSKHGVEILL